MRLVANTQLTGAYGTVVAGQEFECHDPTALELLAMGSVRKAGPPAVRYETKVIVPGEAPQVSARETFRHVPVSDEGSAGMAAEGDLVLSGTNVSQRGAANHSGRRGRSRSDSGGRPDHPAHSS